MRYKKLLVFPFSVSIIFLMGVDKPEDIKSIKNKAFYIEHTQERLDMLKYCKDNYIDNRSDANCRNATEAQNHLRRQNQKELTFELEL